MKASPLAFRSPDSFVDNYHAHSTRALHNYGLPRANKRIRNQGARVAVYSNQMSPAIHDKQLRAVECSRRVRYTMLGRKGVILFAFSATALLFQEVLDILERPLGLLHRRKVAIAFMAPTPHQTSRCGNPDSRHERLLEGRYE